MRNSTAYFAGVATVFTATALGFGGAMIVTNATAPRSPAEPTKLERSVASSAQPSPSPDVKTATIAGTSGTPQSPPLASAAATSVQPQQPASSSPSQPTQTASTASQTPAAAQSSTPAAAPALEQSTANSQATTPANAYAHGSDQDIRKYIRKRERHWARRHYRDDDATTAQASNSAEQNAQSSVSSPSSGSSSQSVPQGQAQPGQIKTADPTSARLDDDNTSNVRRKHDRRWGRGYSKGDDVRIRGEDQSRSFEVREAPREEAPQPFFGMPRWRPLLSDSDDD
jgi:hypothetical protein